MNAKLGQQIEITTKQRMFSYKFYPNPENITPSRMVWMVTFSKSTQWQHLEVLLRYKMVFGKV